MSTRSDITILYHLSPRLIKIAAPSADVTIQDLHDTLRDIEDEPRNLIYPDLIDTAGKEELGGGVFVGLTSALQNAQIMFERRTILLESGTITTASGIGSSIIVEDSTAFFQTNLVSKGDIVVNLTDNSHSEVLNVLGEDQLLVLSPSGGTENDFDIGESYEVYKMVQCEIAGGNVVAVAADGITPISAVFPTFGTQVIRTSSSSATLQEQADIQYASFGGGVTVDATSIYSGTAFPTGTPRQPVNNLADALLIASVRGFTTLFILGDITVDGGADYTGLIFIGESKGKTLLTLDTSAILTDCEFSQATVTGTLDGNAVLKDCSITTLTFISGFVESCVLETGTITLGNTAEANFLDCWSGGADVPIIDLGGSGQDLALRNYAGEIQLINKTGTDDVSIDLASGHIILATTVTNGSIIIRGQGKLTDNSTADVNSQDLLTGEKFTNLQYLVEGLRPHHSATGKIIYWDPVNGDDANAGNVPDAAVATFTEAHDKATDWGHDVIQCLPGNPSAETVFTSPIAITKNFVFVRGPGFDFVLRPNAPNGDGSLVSMTASVGGQLQGIVIDGVNAGANVSGIRMTNHASDLSNLLVQNCSQYGIHTKDCHDNILAGSEIKDCGVAGVLTHNCIHFTLRDTVIDNCPIGLLARADTPGEGGKADLGSSLVINASTTAVHIEVNVVGTTVRPDLITDGPTNTECLLDEGTDTHVADYPSDPETALKASLFDNKTFEDLMIDLLSMANGKIIENPSGTFTFHAQDNTTPRFVLTKVGNERNRS